MEPPSQSTTTSNSGILIRKSSYSSAIILDRYKLGRQLGRGSFAKVYLAKSLIDDSSVAVKVIDKPDSAEMQCRITREISAMRRLQQHPNILKIHEVMATRSKIYLVMELARGGELFAKIAKRGRLTEPAARKYFQQLVSALDFCHQNGVAHRDVKPQNLLLDQSNNLKVSDFGLSALPEQIKDGMLRTACGTPAYTAPEVVCRRAGGYDGRKADAWSCGVLLFFFLAGFLPFDDSNLVAMYGKVHKREYSFPEWISRSARRIIWHLLDPNPNSRMGIELLKSTNWFKKSLKEDKKIALFHETEDSIYTKSSVLGSVNAFDLISMSSGLDLSGLFETDCRKWMRFRTMEKGEVVKEKVTEVGQRLGFEVENGKNGVIGIGKGRLTAVVEVVEVTEGVVMLEVKAAEGGGEVEESHWGKLRAGIEDVVLQWQDEP